MTNNDDRSRPEDTWLAAVARDLDGVVQSVRKFSHAAISPRLLDDVRAFQAATAVIAEAYAPTTGSPDIEQLSQQCHDSIGAAIAWTHRIEDASHSTASAAAAECHVHAVQAQAPAVLETLEGLRAEVAQLRAKLEAQQTARRETQRETARKQRDVREEFAQTVDTFLAKSEADVTFEDAILYAIKRKRKKSLPPWRDLTEKEQKREIQAAKRRYRRARPSR